jgi:hypothetical protein
VTVTIVALRIAATPELWAWLLTGAPDAGTRIATASNNSQSGISVRREVG